MKKLFLIVSLISSLGFSKQMEFQLKALVDPLRIYHKANFTEPRFVRSGAGFEFEFLPLKIVNNKLEFGIGVGTAFDVINGKMKVYDDIIGVKPKKNTTSNLGVAFPVYATMKYNIFTKMDEKTKITYDPLFLDFRIGYSFNVGDNSKLSAIKLVNSDFNHSPYWGLGIGTEYKMFVAELLYQGNFVPNNKTNLVKDGNILHRIGIEFGIRFGINYGKPIELNNNLNEVVTVKPVVEKITPVIIEKKEIPTPKTKKQVVDVEKVYFDFDKSTTNKKSELEKIKNTANTLNKFEYVDVNITGHTDSIGSNEYNDKLGMRRAKFVKSKLEQIGINNNIVNIRQVLSDGENNPYTTNKTDEGRALNRRVEIDYNGWFDENEPYIQ